MIYIKKKDDIWLFDEYFQYLKSIDKKVDKKLYAFIGDTNRYHISHHDSLHDSWLISIQVKFIKGLTNNVKIRFLGPYHDKEFKFAFNNVIKYHFEGKSKKHKDLLIHEFNLNNNNNYEYRFLFSDNTIFYICCEQILVKIKEII